MQYSFKDNPHQANLYPIPQSISVWLVPSQLNQTLCLDAEVHVVQPGPKVASIIWIILARGPPYLKTIPSIRRLAEQFLNLSRLPFLLLLPTPPPDSGVVCCLWPRKMTSWIAHSPRHRNHRCHLRFYTTFETTQDQILSERSTRWWLTSSKPMTSRRPSQPLWYIPLYPYPQMNCDSIKEG